MRGLIYPKVNKGLPVSHALPRVNLSGFLTRVGYYVRQVTIFFFLGFFLIIFVDYSWSDSTLHVKMENGMRQEVAPIPRHGCMQGKEFWRNKLN